MRADAYTKAVLTVIALALVWIGTALAPIGMPVTAQTQPAVSTRVLIAGWIDAGGIQHTFPAIAGVIPGIPVVTHTAPTPAAGIAAVPAAPAQPAASAAPSSKPANWNVMSATAQAQWLACQEDPSACATATTPSAVRGGGSATRGTTAKPAPAQTRVQCAATTQKGTRCSRLAEVGGAFCWQHKGH
jgi:hypothetical protein